MPQSEGLVARGVAPAGKQLLSYKDREGRPNNTANDPDLVPAKVERVEFRMIARPTCEPLCHPSLSQLAYQVTIRVQNADWGHLYSVKPVLSPCLTLGANTDGIDVCCCQGWAE